MCSKVKFRITKIGAYIYLSRGTLSFSWRYRMPWWPEIAYDSSGWFYGFWRFGIEWMAFDHNDPWGEQRCEDMAGAWNMLIDEMSNEDPK